MYAIANNETINFLIDLSLYKLAKKTIHLHWTQYLVFSELVLFIWMVTRQT